MNLLILVMNKNLLLHAKDYISWKLGEHKAVFINKMFHPQIFLVMVDMLMGYMKQILMINYTLM